MTTLVEGPCLYRIPPYQKRHHLLIICAKLLALQFGMETGILFLKLLTMDTLALGCVIPAIRAHSGLAPVS